MLKKINEDLTADNRGIILRYQF